MATPTETAGQAAAWLDEEARAIRQRREAVKLPTDTEAAPTWGLAFSGGGIRSATFCLGLAKALAENKLFNRFDYLSTVSGGGYAGSAIGRLFRHDVDPKVVQEGLARDNTLFYWWLRKNGRYLFPAGLTDAVFAGATMLRGLVAIHFELFLLGMLLCSVVILPHILGLEFIADVQPYVVWTNSMWWLPVSATPILLMTAIWAYWMVSDHTARLERVAQTTFCVLGLVIGALLVSLMIGSVDRDTHSWLKSIAQMSVGLKFIAAQLALSIPAAGVYAWSTSRSLNGQIGAIRNHLTRDMSHVMTMAAAFVAAALLDSLSWMFAAWIAKNQGYVEAGAGGGAMLALLLVLRGILQWLKDRPGSKSPGLNVRRLANALGILVAAGFLFMCASLLQWILFMAPDASADPVELGPQAAIKLAIMMAPCIFFIFATGGNMTWLNTSSLHNFYRARLTRSYVSIANQKRGFTPTALATVQEGAIESLKRVSDVVPGDDVALSEYTPHAHGGPIHLINTCLNQTLDDLTQEFNLDRSGTNLTASSLGYDIGASKERLDLTYPDDAAPSLGQWVAISGAAASPGMGANTSKGLASLLTLCGIRLGFWLNIKARNGKPLIAGSPSHSRFAKYLHLLDELTASFPGSRHPHWYVSDGGHFENTAIYPLLKREVSFIIAADCGADPIYDFGDLNNLLRLARIDLNAEITFLKPGGGAQWVNAAGENIDLSAFGSLPDIAKREHSACLMLAHIQYASGRSGYLLIVKPTMTKGLPYDLVSYQVKYGVFPQQPTSDQFFDEAQWESYFRLGQELGRKVSATLAGEIAAMPVAFTNVPYFTPYSGVGVTIDPEKLNSETKPSVSADVVKSSLGIGAVATVVLSVWQMWDQHRSSVESEHRQNEEILRRALDKSVGADGNLQLNDASLLYLKSVLNFSGTDEYDKKKSEWLTDWLTKLQASCSSATDATDANEVCAAKAAATCSQKETARLQKERCDTLDTVSGEFIRRRSTTRDYWLTGQRIAVKVAAESAKVPQQPVKGAGTTPDKQPQLAGPALSDCRVGGRESRLYAQVYTDVELQQLKANFPDIKERLRKLVEVRNPENVTATAERAGRRPPYRWNSPTFIYHSEGDKACANALAATYREYFTSNAVQVRPLPPDSISRPGTIELWVPPGEAKPRIAVDTPPPQGSQAAAKD